MRILLAALGVLAAGHGLAADIGGVGPVDAVGSMLTLLGIRASRLLSVGGDHDLPSLGAREDRGQAIGTAGEAWVFFASVGP